MLFLGALFGLGLWISGMTDPNKVQGFLDVFGHWNPTLALVLGGAVMVSLVGFQWGNRWHQPWGSRHFHAPVAKGIDRWLVGGSVLFGMGWGMTGVCPGPALVLLGAGQWQAVIFVLAMVAGMCVWQIIDVH